MQSRFLTTILIALCVANGVLSIPLDLEPITAGATATAQETENQGRLNEAKNLANKNIKKMEYVLNNPAMPGHQDMIDSAFGKNSQHDMPSIKNTVQALKSDAVKVPVKLATASGAQTVAFTHYDDSKDPMTPNHVEFGKKYHAKGTTPDARAATLVHEATHYLADTGDYIKDGKMLAGSNPETTNKNGYATGMEPKKSAADLNKDANWKKMRDGHQPTFGDAVPATTDLHKNAESFGQFSAMCGAAVSDAAVGLRRRAMANGNWAEAADYLVKRNSCALPKDYFAKKAAAKKAAEAKAAGKTPAGAKTAKTTAAGAKSKSLLKDTKKVAPGAKTLKKTTPRVSSAKFGKKALAGAKTLAGKKSLAGSKTLAGKKTGLRAKTLAGKKSLVGGKTVAGKKTATRAKAVAGKKSVVGAKSLTGKKTSSRAKTLAGKKTLAGAKTLAGKKSSTRAKTLAGKKTLARPKKALSTKSKVGTAKSLAKAKTLAKGKVGSQTVGRKSKVGSVKPLSKGRVARPVSKTAGSRRPTSKASAGKRLTTKPGAANKHITKTASKRVGKPAANKHVDRPAVSKHVAKPKTNSRTARPVEHAAKPAQRQAKPVQRAKAATTPKAVAPKPKAAAALPKPVAKVAPKKGRRDLEFQL